MRRSKTILRASLGNCLRLPKTSPAASPELLWLWNLGRGPPTIYRHHKGLQIKEGISKGVVYELSEPERTAKPGLHWRCSSWLLWGGARIVGFDLGAIQRFPRSLPDFSRSSADLASNNPTYPEVNRVNPSLWEA